MRHKKTKKRKGRNDAEKLRKAHEKELYWAELKKRHITPEYCRAAIAEFDRLLAEKK